MPRSAAELWWGKDKVPADAHHFYTDNGSYFGTKPEWKVVTWEDIFKERKDKNEHNLWWKKRTNKLMRTPCFVWVFNNYKSNFFGGYYLYIKTLEQDYAINFREPNEEIQKQVMEIFPCGIIPGIDDFYIWAQSFIETFPHNGFKRKAKYQGLKKCWCEVDYYGKLVNILS